MFEVCVDAGKDGSACEFAVGEYESASVRVGCHFLDSITSN